LQGALHNPVNRHLPRPEERRRHLT
jgi:hypothetical protein